MSESTDAQEKKQPGVQAINPSLPKGGGAVKGIGETFQPDAFSGTGSYSIPIYATASRDSAPQLSLDYNSGSGNGIFGIGCSLSTPKISVRTEKGIPEYDGTDVFVLAGSGELVPKLINKKNKPVKDIREEIKNGCTWSVCRYSPRVEETFAEVEHWVCMDPGISQSIPGTSYWKIISGNNVTAIYGQTENARIANPADGTQIFEWLINETIDPKGNKIVYTYKPENNDNVPGEIYEVNRSFTANRYIHSIRYGNYFENNQEKFAFEILFDYGERDLSNLDKPGCKPYREVKKWQCRPDPFSSYRSGFEIRTYRLCRNILMFHHFEKELGKEPCLIRRTTLNYKQTKVVTCLKAVEVTGYRKKEAGSYEQQKMPPLQLGFSSFNPPEIPVFKKLEIGDDTIPGYLDDSQFLPVDLYGEGLPGFLYSNNNTTLYIEPEGEGKYSPPYSLHEFPVDKDMQNRQASLADIEGSGRLELVVNAPTRTGYYQNKQDGTWGNFRSFQAYPTNFSEPARESTDLDGNGKADLLLVEENDISIYPSRGKAGYAPAVRVPKQRDFPVQKRDYKEELVTFADMFGDGLSHRVCIKNGTVECRPNLGYGKFAKKITFANAPLFDRDLDVGRIFFADIDGSGAADLVYVYPDRINIYLNQSGNSFSEPITIMLPEQCGEIDRISFTDIMGNGTTCLIFTKIAPVPRHYYYDFVGEIQLKNGEIQKSMKPYLLNEIDNNLGAVTQIRYCSSTKFYLEDKKAGRARVTKLHFPVQVVEKVISHDKISGSRLVNTFKYHDGYYDPVEREFRGFGYVEAWDTETFEEYEKSVANLDFPIERLAKERHVPPVYTKSWYHTGAFIEAGVITKHYKKEYFQGDKKAYDFPDSKFAGPIHESDRETIRQAYVSLKGQVMRREVYAEDGRIESGNPYTVEESNVEVLLLQAREDQEYAVFKVNPRESISYHYERHPGDPRVQQEFTLKVDDYGNITKACTLFLRRREKPGIYPEQKELKATASLQSYINETGDSRWLGIEYQGREFEIFGLDLKGKSYFSYDESKKQVAAALQHIVPYEGELQPGTLQARQLTYDRTYYWNENQTEALPPGQISPRGLLHHREEAVFTKEFINHVFDGKLTDDTIQSQGGYFYDEETGYWWNKGLVQHYYKEKSCFYMPDKTENSFVEPSSSLFSKTAVDYDPYYLSPVKVTRYIDESDPENIIKNVETLEIDYITLQPKQMIDINNNVSQFLFDPLGQVIVSTLFGTENGEEKGGMRLYPYRGESAEYIRRLTTQSGEPITFDDVLDEPEYYLQGAAGFFFYNLFAQPLSAINLQRDHYYHSNHGTTKFSCMTSIAYFDGFGRDLEAKLKVDPGIAIIRDGEGKLVYDLHNKPLLAETENRWQVTGRTVYNNKGKPCEQYLPYFSNTPYYETQKEIVDEKLVPPPAVIHYDPLERVIKTDTPKGFFSKVEFTPWEEKHYDENDTVEESDFFKEHYPGDLTKDEKDAIDKALKFKNTKAIKIENNAGHVFLDIQMKTADEQLISYYETDILGRVLKSIDPRLYKSNNTKGTHYYNFKYRYEMGEEEPLYVDSADAGKEWRFSNIFGNLVWSWSARDYNQSVYYDRLQRQVKVRVKEMNKDGTAVSDRVVELITYGETQPDSEARNLRGQVFMFKDLSGEIINSQYSIQEEILETSRQMTKEYKKAVNWDDDVQLEPVGYKSTFTYDALGRVMTETTPDESTTTNTYNRAGLLDTVTVTFKDDDPQPIVNHIDYDAKQQRTRIEYGNGITTTYTYEETTLRLIKLHSIRPGQGPKGKARNGVVQNIHYTYDPVGNITRTRDFTYETVFNNNQIVEPLSDYTYDALYRLIKAKGRQHRGINRDTFKNNHSAGDFKQSKFSQLPNDTKELETYHEDYTYDDGNNLVKTRHRATNSWTRQLEIMPDSNRLKKIITKNGKEESRDVSYDASGNMQQLYLNSSLKLAWNCCENLTAAGIIIRPDEVDDRDYYNYDGNEQRTRKVCERLVNKEKNYKVVEKEEKIYLGNYEIKRSKAKTPDGEITTLERQTLRIMDDTTCIAVMHYWVKDDLKREVKKAGTRKLRFQMANNLGSVSLEMDMDAHRISYEEYFPYGGTAIIAGKNQSEVKLKEYRYSGKERDDSTGLYYYGARYYAPWLGRWLKPDPAGTVDGMNLYAFVDGNPVSHEDVGGMMKRKKRGDVSGRKKKRKKNPLGGIFNQEKLKGINSLRTAKKLMSNGSPFYIQPYNCSDKFYQKVIPQIRTTTDKVWYQYQGIAGQSKIKTSYKNLFSLMSMKALSRANKAIVLGKAKNPNLYNPRGFYTAVLIRLNETYTAFGATKIGSTTHDVGAGIMAEFLAIKWKGKNDGSQKKMNEILTNLEELYPQLRSVVKLEEMGKKLTVLEIAKSRMKAAVEAGKRGLKKKKGNIDTYVQKKFEKHGLGKLPVGWEKKMG